jgi:hypothetical protein
MDIDELKNWLIDITNNYRKYYKSVKAYGSELIILHYKSTYEAYKKTLCKITGEEYRFDLDD